jgi:hypothetical protein
MSIFRALRGLSLQVLAVRVMTARAHTATLTGQSTDRAAPPCGERE